jgi:uncharacterized protein (DUF983 family)
MEHPSFLGDYPLWLYFPVIVLGTVIAAIGIYNDQRYSPLERWTGFILGITLFLLPVLQVVHLISITGYCVGVFYEKRILQASVE